MKANAQNLGKHGITDIIFPFFPFLLFLSSLPSSPPYSILLIVPIPCLRRFKTESSNSNLIHKVLGKQQIP